MPTYRVTDPTTGRSLRLTGDSPPTEQELNEVFASTVENIQPQKIETDIPEAAIKSPTAYGLYGAGKALVSEAVKPSMEALGAGAATIAAPFAPVAGTAIGYGIGKKGGELLERGYQKFGEKLGFEKLPEEIKPPGFFQSTLTETGKSAVDVGTALVMPKVFEKAGKLLWQVESAPIKKGVEKLWQFGKEELKNSKISEFVKEGIKSGIRPSVSGKGNIKQIDKYYQESENAIKSIIARKPSGEIPKSLDDFSKSIYETKQKVWQSAHDITLKAGNNKGIMIDLRPAISEMEALGNNANLRRVNKAEAGRLLKMAEEWKQNRQSIRPEEAEELLSYLNNESKAYFKDPNPNSIHGALNYARSANNVRKALFDAIPEGEKALALRKEYGALSAIEKDVAHRAIVFGRKAPKGFFDLADIHGLGTFAYGLAKLDVAALAAGTAIKGGVKIQKYLNNQDRIVSKMFRDVQREMIRRGEIPKPNPYLVDEPGSSFVGENATTGTYDTLGPLKTPQDRQAYINRIYNTPEARQARIEEIMNAEKNALISKEEADRLLAIERSKIGPKLIMPENKIIKSPRPFSQKELEEFIKKNR